MDDFRFDALENIEVPENLISAALDIPNNPPKKTKPFFLGIPFISTAAAALLTLAVGITLWLNVFSNSPAVISQKGGKPEQTVAGNRQSGKPEQTVTGKNGETKPEEKHGTAVTQSRTANGSNSENSVNAPGEDAAQATPEQSGTKPEAKVQRATENTSPAQNPPQSTTSPNKEVTEPQTAPVIYHTEPATEDKPGNPGSSEPETTYTAEEKYFEGKLKLHIESVGSGGGNITCSIYNEDGTLSGVCYTETFSLGTAGYEVAASPVSVGIRLYPGKYRVVFSNEIKTLAEATITITNWNTNASYMLPGA